MLRKELERKLTLEMAGIYLSVIGALATWISVLLFQSIEAFQVIGVGVSFFVCPVLIGILVRRPWVAAWLTCIVILNLILAFSVKFGVTFEHSAKRSLIVSAVPIIMSAIISLCANRLAGLQIRRKPNA